MNPLNAHLEISIESSVILVPLNSQQSYPSMHSLHWLIAHLEELSELLIASVYNYVFLHSIASKVFRNLEVFPELLTLVLVPYNVFL
jgi:hypothetical protein